MAPRRSGFAMLLVCATACGGSWGNDNSAPVDVTVTLDGATVIDRGFGVGDQHNYIEHRIRLDHGTHPLTAHTVIDGENVELSEEFTIDPGQQRYAALGYWHYVPTRSGDTSFTPPGFNFPIQDDPFGLA